MINKRQYEECYCPENKDPHYPENWIRRKYVLDYPKDVNPPYPSDADIYTMIHKAIIMDPNLDNYTLSIYLRLNLLTEFKHSWTEIYNYGSKENVNRALNKLKEQKYIEFLDNNSMKIYY